MKIRYLLLLLPVFVSSMNGYQQIGYGTQSKGMGGVGIALPQDSLASAYNPAGMTLLYNRYDIGIDWIDLQGSSTTPPLSSSENTVWPELGVSWMPHCDVALGVAFYLKGAIDVDYRKPDPAFGNRPLKFRYRQYFLSPSWAWAINDCHSIGIALNIAYGSAKAGGLQFLTSEHPTDLTNRGTESEWGIGFRVGWLGHFMNMFSVGITYESKTWMGRFDKYRGFFPDGGEFNSPGSFGVGGAFHFCPEFVIAMDFNYIFWEGVPAFGNRANTRRLFGSKGGPGFDWKDQFVYKLGVAYDLWDCFTLRMGYNYGQDPIRSRAIAINKLTLDTMKHHITVGATYGWCYSELSIAYIHGLKNTQTRGNTSISGHQDQVSISFGQMF